MRGEARLLVRAFFAFAAGTLPWLGGPLGVVPHAYGAGLDAATLISPADGATFKYGAHIVYCYVVPVSAPNSADGGSLGTRLDFYIDGEGSYNEPDNSDRGTKQCPLDQYATKPGVHTWWIKLSIVSYDQACECWQPTGETSTSEKFTYTVQPKPSGPVGVSINSGATYTTTPAVTLHVSWPSGATGLIVSNDGGFANSKTFDLDESVAWTLVSSGDERLPKTVYLRFEGTGDTTYTDDIILDETPPSVTSPAAAITADAGGHVRFAAFSESGTSRAAAAGTSHQVLISWSGSDSNSGLAKFELQQRAGSGSWTAVALPSATATSATATLAVGSYQFRVRGKDKAGNVSAWATSATVVVPEVYVPPTSAAAGPSTTPTASAEASLPGEPASPGVTNAPTTGATTPPVDPPEVQSGTAVAIGLAFAGGVAVALIAVVAFLMGRRLGPPRPRA